MRRGGHRGIRTNGKRSKFEDSIAKSLDARGISYEYEKRRLSYELPRVYIPDFELANGIIVEAKGWFKPEDRRKMIEVQRVNPSADIRFVFQTASLKLSRGTKSATYGQWATRHGFIWAEGTVPDTWAAESRKER